MSKEQRDALDGMLRQTPRNDTTLAEQRAGYDELLRSVPLADDLKVGHAVLGGVAVVDIHLTGVSSDDVTLYLHGGGYSVGSADAFAAFASEVGRRAGTRVVCVEYRLAPENPYPAALDDAIAAYRGLLDSGVPASRIAVAGDSAGAGLAVATMVRLRNEGLPLPSAAVLISPWVDLTLSGTSMTNKRDAEPVMTQVGLRDQAVSYVGAGDPTNPLISPIFADLAGLPPLLIQVGSNEILLDDATRLATVAAAANVEVTLEVTPEVPHGFHLFAAVLEEGDIALNRAGAFLRARFDACS